MNCLLRGMKGLEAHIITRGDAQFAFKKGILSQCLKNSSRACPLIQVLKTLNDSVC